MLHEKEHIRQWDHIWKFTAHIILILNWYNPFMWLAYKKFADDIELACDERVVRNLNNEERKNYALTLMDYSSNKYVSLGKSLYFGRENTKKRIINVLNYKKPIVFIVCIFVVLIIILAIGLLTVPDASTNQNIYDLLRKVF